MIRRHSALVAPAMVVAKTAIASVIGAALSGATAAVMPERDDQFIEELKSGNVPAFYSVCDFGTEERLVWFLSAPTGYGMLVVYDRATGEGSTFGTFALSDSGKQFGGDMAHGTWQFQKYAKGPYGAGFLENFEERSYQMALPGTDSLPVILARTDVAQCGSPEDVK